MDDPLYSTPIGTDLVVSSTSQGIVNNDFEIDSAALVASVVASPSHGTIVSFHSNGTFTYWPTTGYSGPDSFSYQVSNGSVDSNVVTVSPQVGQVFGPRTNLDEIPLSNANFPGANILSQPLTLGQKLVYNSNTEPRDSERFELCSDFQDRKHCQFQFERLPDLKCRFKWQYLELLIQRQQPVNYHHRSF